MAWFLGYAPRLFRSSSMAEHPAVNRRVVSSSLTCGANFMFWVYVLENPRGKFYIGQTGNLTVRVQDHNRTDCFEGHFTRKNGPWKLVWSEAHRSRSSALQRERQIKRMKSAKWIRAHLLAAQFLAVNPDGSGL
jgi:putative endonuclease